MDRTLKKLREAFNLLEATPSTQVSLIPDLYEDEDEVWDETEIRSSFIEEDDLNRTFTLQIMSPEEAKGLETGGSNQTVWDV